jgi:hypothetical protein
MPTTMKLIAKNVLGSAANTIDFQSIPGTYTDLSLVASLRADFNTVQHYAVCSLTFNNSGGTAYSNRRLVGTPTAAVSFSDSSQASFQVIVNGTASTASTFGQFALYVPNYAGASNKSASGDLVQESNSAANSEALNIAYAYLWANTAAIDRITLTAGSGNFVSGSSAFLYGISRA